MNRISGARIGVLWGVLAGIVYVIMLFARYQLFASTTYTLAIASVISYAVFVVMLFVAAYFRRRQLEEQATAKDIFASLFIVILIAELCFAIFNYIYLMFIDPAYLDRFGQQTIKMMQEMKVSAEKIKEFSATMEEQRSTSMGTMIMGWAQSVIVDSILGLIIAFVMKKKPQLQEMGTNAKF